MSTQPSADELQIIVRFPGLPVRPIGPGDDVVVSSEKLAQFITTRDAQLKAALLEVLPEKPRQVPGNKLPYINRGYIEGEVNGAIKAIDDMRAGIEKVFGEKKRDE